MSLISSAFSASTMVRQFRFVVSRVHTQTDIHFLINIVAFVCSRAVYTAGREHVCVLTQLISAKTNPGKLS
jgi:hypothetical protein